MILTVIDFLASSEVAMSMLFMAPNCDLIHHGNFPHGQYRLWKIKFFEHELDKQVAGDVDRV